MPKTATKSRIPVVWGVHVGEEGSQLPLFATNGPFPPAPGTRGRIAIGWPAVGDLRTYEGDYHSFVESFRRIYGENYDREQTFKAAANVVWKFAFEMKERTEDREGDWVICPSSAHDAVLVGEIVGAYESDFHNESGLYGRRRPDFVHTRGVEWHGAFEEGSPQHQYVYRIGQQTVCRPSTDYFALQALLHMNDAGLAETVSILGRARKKLDKEGSRGIKSSAEAIEEARKNLSDVENPLVVFTDLFEEILDDLKELEEACRRGGWMDTSESIRHPMTKSDIKDRLREIEDKLRDLDSKLD